MTHPTHDTLVDLDRGTPRLFIAVAFSLPALIGLQFIVAGQALFGSLSWEPHGTLGGLIGIWVLALLGYSLALPRLRGFGWWTGLLTLLYALQLALASLGPAALAFHPFNAGLLLTASLVVVIKVERRRSFRTGDV